MTKSFASPDRKNVFTMGAGKAAKELHLPLWTANDLNVTLYDSENDRLNPLQFPELAQKMYKAGRMFTLPDLDELTVTPDIVDIATSSGQHIRALETFLDVADRRQLGKPANILIEKPVTSDPVESARLKALIESGDILEDTVYVNENYNASRGAERIKQIIDEETAKGNPLVGVDVAFSKDRVPDVLKGRFTDPVLGAYGIELPHQLAVAYNLAGVGHDDPVKVLQNDYYKNVNGIEHSEGTFTELETGDGIVIRLAQGLGPFMMHPDGRIVEQDPGITRFATTHFKDGNEARVLFDPAPGVPRFHSVVEWHGEQIIIPDNTLQTVIGMVAARQPVPAGLAVRNAINYADSLAELRRAADERR